MTRWLKIVIVGAPAALASVLILAVRGIIATSTAVSAFVLLALFVAVTILGYHVWRGALAQSADLLMRFEQIFFTAEKRRQRSLAAINNLEDPRNFTEMEDILDFFETIAMLTRKEALDLSMVGHTFRYWVVRYCAIAEQHIESRQNMEPGVWEDLAWLLAQLASLDKHTALSSPIDPEERLRFLSEEGAEA